MDSPVPTIKFSDTLDITEPGFGAVIDKERNCVELPSALAGVASEIMSRPPSHMNILDFVTAYEVSPKAFAAALNRPAVLMDAAFDLLLKNLDTAFPKYNFVQNHNSTGENFGFGAEEPPSEGRSV